MSILILMPCFASSFSIYIKSSFSNRKNVLAVGSTTSKSRMVYFNKLCIMVLISSLSEIVSINTGTIPSSISFTFFSAGNALFHRASYRYCCASTSALALLTMACNSFTFFRLQKLSHVFGMANWSVLWECLFSYHIFHITLLFKSLLLG